VSKVGWIVGSYALALVVGGLLWLILRATGDPEGRAAGIAVILVLGIFSFGLAAMYSWLTIVRSEPADRPYGAFLAFVRILQGSGFFLILWKSWVGAALFGAGVVVNLVGRQIAGRHLRAREVSDTARV
jgi:MFS family permease